MRFVSRTAIAVILSTQALGVSGCASLGRKAPVDDKAVKARQLSQQGMTAFYHGRWQDAIDKELSQIRECAVT